MTEENKIVEVKNECFCQSKGFRKFLITALGSFVGVFCAISLFAALHKPPMPPCPFGPMMRAPMHCPCHHFKRHDRGDFHHRFVKRDFKRVEKRDIAEKPPVRFEKRVEK